MSEKKRYSTIDEYIDDQPSPTKEALRTVKKCILSAAPDAEELFNYDIPAFALVQGGKREQQIMMAGYAKHVGFYPHPDTISEFAHELSAYKQGKGSIQFPNSRPIPEDLIVRMVKRRMEMLGQKAKD